MYFRGERWTLVSHEGEIRVTQLQRNVDQVTWHHDFVALLAEADRYVSVGMPSCRQQGDVPPTTKSSCTTSARPIRTVRHDRIPGLRGREFAPIGNCRYPFAVDELCVPSDMVVVEMCAQHVVNIR